MPLFSSIYFWRFFIWQWMGQEIPRYLDMYRSQVSSIRLSQIRLAPPSLHVTDASALSNLLSHMTYPSIAFIEVPMWNFEAYMCVKEPEQDKTCQNKFSANMRPASSMCYCDSAHIMTEAAQPSSSPIIPILKRHSPDIRGRVDVV